MRELHALLLRNYRWGREGVIVATGIGFYKQRGYRAIIELGNLCRDPTNLGEKRSILFPASYCRLFDSVPISTEAISSANRANRIVIGKELNLDLPILKCGINVGQSILPPASPFHFSLLFQIFIGTIPCPVIILALPAACAGRRILGRWNER